MRATLTAAAHDGRAANASWAKARERETEEAFHVVATLYQALLSAEETAKYVEGVTDPALAEFLRGIRDEQLRIAERARRFLVDLAETDDVAAAPAPYADVIGHRAVG